MTWFGLSAIHKENLITREDQIFSESTKKKKKKANSDKWRHE